MAILVIAEHDNASIKPATLNAVSAAAKMGGDIHVLVAGSGCAAAAEAAAKIAGVGKVRVADAAHYADQTAENMAALVVANAAGYSHIVAPATTGGKNFMPRVAALLDVMQISDVIKVYADDVIASNPNPAYRRETATRLDSILDFFEDMTLADINGAICREYVFGK